MEDVGFIKYYQAMPSLALFQLKNMNTYRFEALNIATKHRVIEYVQIRPFICEPGDLNVMQALFTGNNRIYSIVYLALPDSTYSKFYNLANAIIDSFEIIPMTGQ